MAKRQRRKSVDRAQFSKYRATAEHFFEASENAMELEHWNAAGVLIVHSAIAFADALAIKLSGEKSAGESHEDAIALLDEAVADGEEKEKALNQFRRIIEEKTRVSYSGEMYSASQTRELWKRLVRFRTWAEGILTR